MSYRIREVDGLEEEDTLAELHGLTFLDEAKLPSFEDGHWWLGYRDRKPVAFAGLVPSMFPKAGYFIRVGVVPEHGGHGLQLRFMRVLERRAKSNGWAMIVSDTTDNVRSANNFIRAGYRLFEPEVKWAFPHSLYWRKHLYL
ncbi:GNAT family N-acetyltransferase [Bradyrhizobium ottawaense]|uniref:GNAT family N-acetyltransferase n=1 Tax=Bradyrhizobium ottawaense TaxID=931866 RepID=UPI0027146B14|nr:GNAT family N-acetyltransferase [Bradyrhizobium ottawaense]WLB49246.1 GNAT family N-acetyltransferase [Bradyrhizobium ottawaense]